MTNERGFFEIKLASKTIPLRFCTGTVKLFCERKGGMSLTDFLTYVQSSFTIDDTILILLCAAEYVHNRNSKGVMDFPYTQDDAMDWIDELGGIAAPEFLKVWQVFVASLNSNAPVVPADDIKKKKAA